MSVHTSLRSSKQMGATRNVLKRYERVRHLMAQGVWTDGRSAFGLPKIKQTRIKARKAAAKEKEEAQTAPPAAGTTPSASASS